MTDEILTTLILAAQGVTVAIIGVIASWVTTVKKQVKNSHDINLRDDIDKKHLEIRSEIRGMDVRITRQIEDVADRQNITDTRLDTLGSLVIKGLDKHDRK